MWNEDGLVYGYMNKNQKGFLTISLILIVMTLIGAGVYIKVYPKNVVIESTPNPENVVCSMDAKLCGDGSYVGRTGPNCEFSECPFTVVEVATTASLNQRIFLGGGIFITPLEVISDSRCPVDVTCIWAGEVVLRARVEKDMNIEEVEIKMGTSVDAGPGTISLVNVSPEKNTKKPFEEKDYKFTFSVSWKPD